MECKGKKTSQTKMKKKSPKNQAKATSKINNKAKTLK